MQFHPSSLMTDEKRVCSHHLDLTLAIWMHWWQTGLTHPRAQHCLVVCVSVRVVDIVVDTSCNMEPRWRPELADVVGGMVPIQEVLREEGYREEASKVSLSTRVERS